MSKRPKNKPVSATSFTVTLKTRDGLLVMQRGSDRHYFVKPNGEVDDEFTRYSLGIDARTKGCKVLDYFVGRDEIFCTVAYL